MGNKFFSYDGQFNNCQDFLLGLLRGNRCLTPEAQEFINQSIAPVRAIFPIHPLGRAIDPSKLQSFIAKNDLILINFR